MYWEGLGGVSLPGVAQRRTVRYLSLIGATPASAPTTGGNRLMTSDTHPDRPIDTRLKIAALWTATMLIFAYVDLFSLYRPDVRADLDAGKMFVFNIGQPFLFFTTLYIIIPAVMIYLTLVMPRRINRIVNMVLAALYGFTIVGGAIGEWNYYVLGSLVEAVLLVMLFRHAWSWSEVQMPAAEAPVTGAVQSGRVQGSEAPNA